jgi:VWFA-related protein
LRVGLVLMFDRGADVLMRVRRLAGIGAVLLAVLAGAWAQTPAGDAGASAARSSAASLGATVLSTTVRRVVLDVTVTDSKGAPVPGLTAADFEVSEDGKPQRILSFDANGFSSAMDYVPPKLPPQPPNTFLNLPKTPEKGPLYVLLYDLVNMDSWDQMDSEEDHRQQMIAREQMVKFIEEKPEGARFAIFVRSDGLHLIQGFTSDKALLYDAIESPRPHFPKVFLMAPNFGRGDRVSSLNTLNALATYLNGLPGRKDLIWFASQFPLSLFADDSAGPNYQAETKATLDLLAHDQIAIYPVDARGVALQDSYSSLGTSVHSDTITSATEAGAGGPGGGSGGGGTGSSPSTTSSFVQGSSTVNDSYSTMDGIAKETGGEAFYSNNDVAGELVKATENGGVYYTLTYSPTDTNYDGKLRAIEVKLAKKGYELAYRRYYYGTAAPSGSIVEGAATPGADAAKPKGRQVGDSLSANMEHGAPTAHQLLFIVQAHSMGAPTEGTPQEMAELATEPAYFQSRRKSVALKPLPPVPLEKDVFDFNIPVRQFEEEPSLDLEVAAAVYDADGQLMNAFVRVAKKELDEAPGAAGEPRFFRIEEELEVPEGAATMRFAVRDRLNDRLGAMEVKLPLAPEGAAAVAH